MSEPKEKTRIKLTLGITIAFSVFMLVFSTGCAVPADTGFSHKNPVTPLISPKTSINLTDSLGNGIILPHAARRIICQNGMAAELLVGIGSRDRIIGVTDALLTEKYVIKKIPRAQSIGQWDMPDVERILSLKPDVMLAYTSKTKNIDKIIAANITVLYIDCNKIRDVPQEARKIGILTGNEAGAEKYAQYIQKYLDLLDSRLSNLTDDEQPRVYVEHYNTYSAQSPTSPGGVILQLLKAKNIAANISTQSSVVTPEWIVEQDPDIIVKYVSRTENLSASYSEMKNRILFSNISAIRNDQVYAIKGDVISGPRGVAGLLYLAKKFYPDRFGDIDPDTVLHEYAETFVPGSDEVDTYLPHR